MAPKLQLLSSSNSSDSETNDSLDSSASDLYVMKQKPVEERHPDEEDTASKDEGKGKKKVEEKSLPDDDTASKDSPNRDEKQRSGEVNSESHSPAGTDSATSTPPKKSSSRATSQRRSKRLKKEANEENAMKLFQRVWTEEDEIVILDGMINYKDKMGEDPSSDMGAFHGYILKSLSFVCTKIQLREKIRRLKEKYLRKANKGEQTFSTPHEGKVFLLSENIWSKQEVTKAAEGAERVNVNIPISKSLGVASLEAEILAFGLDVVGGPEKEALEKRWKSLRIAELKAFLVRNKILADQAKLLLDYYEAS